MSRITGLALALLAPLAHSQASWDVTSTGQPFEDAEFTVTEGTWMSVDVSPDGNTIVFDMLGDIYAMPAIGGEARAILDGPAMQRSPLFSADGANLLFLSDASGGDNVWMAKWDGSAARQITHETVDVLTGPTWGPDGQSVVAAKMESIVSKLHSSELRLFDVRGGTGRVLVAAPQNQENVHEAEFSPDGRSLYYTEKMTPPSASHVYIDANHANFAIQRRDMTSGATEEVVRGFGGATTPRLSRDGKRLAFVRRVKDKTVLFVYDLATREQRPVYDALDRDGQADFIGQGHYYPRYGWFPDNRHIAIWGKGKLFRVDVESSAHEEIPFRVTARHRITTPPRFEHDLAPARVTVRAIRHLAVAPGGEHNFPVANYYADVVQLMAHAGSATTPTLIVNFGELMGENYMYQTTRAWEDPKIQTFVQATTSGYSPLAIPHSAPAYARNMTTIHVADELWDIGFRAVARSMKKLDDAGVVVNAGSHGQIHGLDQHWEMWLMAQGGMSNLHVLRTSTLNGARTLALDRQIGSLEAGKLADLLVLDANPLEDIHNTNTVRYTVVNGRLYDAHTMNEAGHYDRPRTRFYWELDAAHGADWKSPWAEH